jgi:hypothetical protein
MNSDENVPSENKKQENFFKISFCWRLVGQ